MQDCYVDEMPISGAFVVQFSGPEDRADDFITALAEHQLAAETCPPMYPGEANLGWVRVLTHEGSDDHPSTAFQDSVLSRASAIAAGFGFTLRSHGLVL